MKLIIVISLTLVCFSSLCQDSLWTKVYYSQAFYLNSEDAVLTGADGLVLCGKDQTSGFVCEVDSLGGLMWEKLYDELEFEDIERMNDSNVVISSRYYDSQNATLYPSVAMFDAVGDTLWSRAFEITGQQQCLRTVIDIAGDSTIALAWTNDISNDLHIVRLNGSGDSLWTSSFTWNNPIYLTDIEIGTDSSIYLSGYVPNLSFQNSLGLLVHITSSGQVDWSYEFFGATPHDIQSVNNYVYLAVKDYYNNRCNVMRISGSNFDTDVQIDNVFIPDYPEDPVRLTALSDGNLILTSLTSFASSFGVLDLNCNSLGEGWTQMKIQQVVPRDVSGFYLAGNGPIYGIKSLTDYMGIYKCDSTYTDGLCTSYSLVNNGLSGIVSTLTTSVTTTNNTINLKTTAITQSSSFMLEESNCIADYSGLQSNGSFSFELFPNPSNGLISIVSDISGTFHFNLFNMEGQEILSSQIEHNDSSIDLQYLKSGVYHYLIQSNDGQQLIRDKLVISK